MSENCPASRTVAFSRAEQVHIVMPTECNQSFRLFGGKLMEWVDVVAAVVARRHCGGEVTTASVDRLDFLAPAKLNDIVVLKGRLVYVGRTSMLVCVDTFVEDADCPAPEHTHVNRAYLTMVALGRDRLPAPVPRLLLETDEEKADFAAAQARREAARQTSAPGSGSPSL